MRLITNNPDKISALEADGIAVSERVELKDFINADNSNYLITKVKRMNHLLNVPDEAAPLADEIHESE